MSINLYKQVVNIWFEGVQRGKPIPQSRAKKWFGSSEYDNVSKGFVNDIRNHINEGFNKDKVNNATDALGLVLLLDQFSRNSWRGAESKLVYTKADPLAQKYSHHFIEKKYDLELEPIEKIWFYLPLMHSEDKKHHELALEKFQEARDNSKYKDEFIDGVVDYEIKHKNMIEQFGRYPYRNQVLGRESTKEEEEYMKNGGETFTAQN
eukprot:TRINITY_DN3760_c0_g1_i4.p1 TRINITY_DN3760_c0_g1~~TRINITY_DN3760_c0_g1_i4.p1  ORF type:complete len:207 (-),score=48.80 TRINITY_DN3760_c0_g1_i4:119-739(-)